jgi:DNA-binding transcriptional ArsR family regulator
MEEKKMSKRAGKKESTTGKRKPAMKGSFGRPAHEQLVKGLSHPVRTECLTVLSDRVASPREISEALNHDLSNVSYHVRVLSELGLIELVREEQVRGTVAHFYKAVERPLVSAEEWENLTPAVREAISAYGWEALINDVSEALEKGTFDDRSDRHLSRTPLLLDSEGFERLSGIFDEVLEAILEEQAASAARMNRSGKKPIHAMTALALFTMPEPK